MYWNIFNLFILLACWCFLGQTSCWIYSRLLTFSCWGFHHILEIDRNCWRPPEQSLLVNLTYQTTRRSSSLEENFFVTLFLLNPPTGHILVARPKLNINLNMKGLGNIIISLLCVVLARNWLFRCQELKKGQIFSAKHQNSVGLALLD